jgi:hypothetical protein
MREAVHAVCREGLVVAIENRMVPVEFGFPHGMPLVDGSNIPTAPGYPQASGFPSAPIPQQYGQPPYPPISSPFPQMAPDGRHRQEHDSDTGTFPPAQF